MSRNTKPIPALLLLLAVLACDTREAMEPELRFEISRADQDIDEAKRAMAAGGDPTFPCTAVKQAIAHLSDRRVHDVQRVIREGVKVCREATVGYAAAQIRRLDEARGRERERMARECTDLARAVALVEALDPNDAEVPSLRKKRKSLCP